MKKSTPTKTATVKAKAPAKADSKATAPANAKTGSKAATIIALLRRANGASLDEMISATGWQKHSVRGFMAGALKKQHGLTVTSERTNEGRTYRIADEVQQ